MPHLVARDGEEPTLPPDSNTPTGCTWWRDNQEGSIPCSQIPAFYGVSLKDFLYWVCYRLRLGYHLYPR